MTTWRTLVAILISSLSPLASACAVAGEAGVPLYSISRADFLEMFVGGGARPARDPFEPGKEKHPAHLFAVEDQPGAWRPPGGPGGGPHA